MSGPGIRLARWGAGGEAVVGKDALAFVLDHGEDPPDLVGGLVVSPRADADRIEALLAGGARQVLVGEAALRDGGLVPAAIARHGAGRIGVWLPVRLVRSSWTLDRESNADFSFVSIPAPVPRWVALRADGSATDVDALWWAGEQVKAGCATVLVSIPAPADDDLLACAEMAEVAGERFWLDTGSADPAELRWWVRYGQVRQLLLPPDSALDQAMAALDGLIPDTRVSV
jgi:hypothetical protein